MRYDRELQSAGKFFVQAIQGDDTGKQGRELMKALQNDADMSLVLKVVYRDGKLLALVGTERWGPKDEFPSITYQGRKELE